MKPHDSRAITELAQALGNALFDNSVMRARPRTHHELREWLRDYFDRAATLDAGEPCVECDDTGYTGGYRENGNCVRCTSAPPAPAVAAVAEDAGRYRWLRENEG
jgi:hypothetical protein